MVAYFGIFLFFEEASGGLELIQIKDSVNSWAQEFVRLRLTNSPPKNPATFEKGTGPRWGPSSADRTGR